MQIHVCTVTGGSKMLRDIFKLRQKAPWQKLMCGNVSKMIRMNSNSVEAYWEVSREPLFTLNKIRDTISLPSPTVECF